jgi:hypothetical protein
MICADDVNMLGKNTNAIKKRGRDHLEDLGIDGKIILELILGKQGVDWLRLTQDRGQWQTVVIMVMSFWVASKVGSFLNGRVTISLSRRTVLHGVN